MVTGARANQHGEYAMPAQSSGSQKKTLREELTLSGGSHGGLRPILRIIAVGRPQGDIGGTAALSHRASGNRHHDLLVPDLRHHRGHGIECLVHRDLLAFPAARSSRQKLEQVRQVERQLERHVERHGGVMAMSRSLQRGARQWRSSSLME